MRRPLSVDTHCHVYPDAIAERAVAGVGGFYGRPIEKDGRLRTVLASMEDGGIGRLLTSAVATTPHQVASVNRYQARIAAAYPDRISGMGTLHPDSPDQRGDVENAVELGLVGIKLHPDIQGVAIDDPRYLRIFELLEGRLPVCCHFGDSRYDFSNPDRVGRVLRLFPGLTLIGAHFGGWSIWREAVKVLPAYQNLLVDCSSSLFALSPSEAADMVRAYGAERVLYGDDYPMWDPAEERDRFDALPLTEAERRMILYENALRVYGIPAENLG